jgi:bud emergence protein 1
VLSIRFVAKPIGRLGGPGLIPVSFVEIRDPVTSRPIENVAELLQQGSVPQVDAWKKAAEDYKAASIPLGSFDYPQSRQGRHQADGSDRGSFSRGTPERKESADEGAKTDVQLRDGEIISTHVKSFHYEAEAYWFRINALFLPDDPDAQAVSLVLYRLYEDFYNFQITLLDLFPKEAGRGGSRDSYQSGTAPAERILPYMPGPLEQVDVDITNTRREDLDTYLRELLALRNMNAEYILRHEHVLGFFSPGPGDMMENISRRQADTMAAEVAATQAADAENYRQNAQSDVHGGAGADRRSGELEDRLGDLHVGSRNSSSTGRGSPITPSEQAFFGNGNARTSMNGSGSGSGSGHVPLRSSRLSSNASGQHLARGGSPASSNGPGGVASPPTGTRGLPSPFSPGMATGSTASSFGSGSAIPGGGRLSGNQNHNGGNVPLPHQTSSPASGTSTAAANGPAFIKIKILDRNTDDMIAIRVPPRVTYDQLVDKVRDRLVAQVSRLQYRNAAGGEEFSDVLDDRTLREWLDREDKLVLYAE